MIVWRMRWVVMSQQRRGNLFVKNDFACDSRDGLLQPSSGPQEKLRENFLDRRTESNVEAEDKNRERRENLLLKIGWNSKILVVSDGLLNL